MCGNGLERNTLDNAFDETDATNASKDFITVANIPHSIELPKVVEVFLVLGRYPILWWEPREMAMPDVMSHLRGRKQTKRLYQLVSLLSMMFTFLYNLVVRYTVRIVNICSKTWDSVLHEICWSCGFLIKVVRIDENTPDAFFDVEKKSYPIKIQKRLNYTIVDDCDWSATLESNDTAANASTRGDEEIDDASCNSGLKIGKRIAELKQLYNMKIWKICMELSCTQNFEMLL